MNGSCVTFEIGIFSVQGLYTDNGERQYRLIDVKVVDYIIYSERRKCPPVLRYCDQSKITQNDTKTMEHFHFHFKGKTLQY